MGGYPPIPPRMRLKKEKEGGVLLWDRFPHLYIRRRVECLESTCPGDRISHLEQPCLLIACSETCLTPPLDAYQDH